MSRNPPLDFIGIGPQRAGTTWLYKRLNELSQFEMPCKKELHYFDRNTAYPSPSLLDKTTLSSKLSDQRWLRVSFRQLIRSIRESKSMKDVKWLTRYFLLTKDDPTYLKLFANMKGITGDITPSYSILKRRDIQRMHDLLPDAKLIFLLRNPIERTWSQVQFSMRKSPPGHEFTEDELLSFIKSNGVSLRSNYLRTIDHYSQFYPSDQIFFGFFDAIQEQPEDLMKNIVRFLGGDPEKVSQECKLHRRNNVSAPYIIPPAVADYLSGYYGTMIEELANTFGEYCNKWQQELNGLEIESNQKFKSFAFLGKDFIQSSL